MKINFKQTDLPNLAKRIIKELAKQKNAGATVLALTGDLGTGKTTLTKEIAKQLGIKKNIISPTFVIMKFYSLPKDQKILPSLKKLVHLDAYRLEDENDLLKIGWQEIMTEPNLVIVEWPEIVKKEIPQNALLVKLSHIDEKTRQACF
jgi:tRNA threonylcarbamoyladenosine biosynthesis protein TsaE